MTHAQRDGTLMVRRTGGAVVAMLTSKLVVDMLADQPRSVRLAAAVVWAMAFVWVWDVLLKMLFTGKSGDNTQAI